MLCPSVGTGHDSQPWLSLLLGCAAIWINVSNTPSLVEGWWSAPAHRSVVVEHHFLNHASSVMLKSYAQSILFTYLAFLPRCRFPFAFPEGTSLPYPRPWGYVLFPLSLLCVGRYQYLSKLASTRPVFLVCLMSSLEIILLIHV